MENKRENLLLIPYKVSGKQIFVFLQRRGKESNVLPDSFSFFGGKIESGETPEQALVREIKEELDFNLGEYIFLGNYQSPLKKESVLHIYYSRVSDNFENEIKIGEGEYSKFFSENEVI